MQEPESLPNIISDSILKMNREAAESYHDQLSDRALEYLEERGLRESASTFLLGEVSEPVPGHERFQGMLSIPYLGPRGDVYQIRYRCLQNHDCKEAKHGKYNQESGVETMMFNVGALTKPGLEVSVAEGELDAITLESYTDLPAVGMPGANNWKPHFKTMLEGYQRVYVWADPDKAGRDLAKTILKAVRSAVVVPLDQDVNDTLRAYDGPFGLHQVLEDVR